METHIRCGLWLRCANLLRCLCAPRLWVIGYFAELYWLSASGPRDLLHPFDGGRHCRHLGCFYARILSRSGIWERYHSVYDARGARSRLSACVGVVFKYGEESL